VQSTLKHFVLAVKAELASITVAGQAVEQIDIVEYALYPEGERA